MFRKIKGITILIAIVAALVFAYKSVAPKQETNNNTARVATVKKKPSFKVNKPKVNKPHFTKPKVKKPKLKKPKAPAPRHKRQVVHTYKRTVKKPKAVLTKPFKYLGGRRKLVLGKMDSLGRATGSHIQLKESETPKVQRSQWLTVRPSGWHNYKFRYNGKTTWLFNRGHLVGYQFCGLNNEPRNLVTETQYLNQGAVTHMDDNNNSAMLFYENRLRSWMRSHYSDSLDYSVIPVYRGSELVPRGVRLTFVGYSTNGAKQRITMPSSRIKYHGKVGQVYLANSTPVAHINYMTGTAQIVK